MYILINEDLTNVGGPMGNNSSSIRYRKYFYNLRDAKRYAEQEYNEESHEGISSVDWEWKRYDGSHYSPDLGYVMYTIRKLKVEEWRKNYLGQYTWGDPMSPNVVGPNK